MSYRHGAGALAIASALVPHQVHIEFARFGPTQLDVLPAETVVWTNVSVRQHTVTSDAGVFGSALLSNGARFTWTFAGVGAYPYHCTVHAGMIGEVDVRRVTLSPVPTAVVRPGTPVELTGRTADPSVPVRIERSTDGTHFAPAATATPTTSGDWHAKVTVRATADYRATSGTDVSEIRRLHVSSSRVHVRASRAGVAVTVAPKDPYGRVMLQRHIRERFGWWPVARKRLDYVSEARFRVRRPARVRVLLLDTDGWTPLAISRVIHLRRS
jgi:plastocyanin